MASETCAFDIIGAKFIREIQNGEVVVITENGIESIKPFPKVKERPCIFEIHILFKARQYHQKYKCLMSTEKDWAQS